MTVPIKQPSYHLKVMFAIIIGSAVGVVMTMLWVAFKVGTMP